MAGGTVIARLNMVEWFARRVAAVVTRGTRQVRLVMIEFGYHP